MKMKFLCKKLVRDLCHCTLERKNIKAVTVSLEREALVEAFRAKIVEEAAEVAEAKNRVELIEELADLQEVIESFIKFCDISPALIEEIRKAKRENMGGFDEGLYIDHIEVPHDSPHLNDYSLRPHKYPPLEA